MHISLICFICNIGKEKGNIVTDLVKNIFCKVHVGLAIALEKIETFNQSLSIWTPLHISLLYFQSYFS